MLPYLVLVSETPARQQQLRTAPALRTAVVRLSPYSCHVFPTAEQGGSHQPTVGEFRARSPDPDSLCPLEVWSVFQVQVLALWHERRLELDRDGAGGASRAPDGDAEGHEVYEGVVSVELLGGRAVRCLQHVAEGSCRHSGTHQTPEPPGPRVLPHTPIPAPDSHSAPSTGSCWQRNHIPRSRSKHSF